MEKTMSLLAAMAVSASAWTPVFDTAQTVTFNGVEAGNLPIDVGGYGQFYGDYMPTFTDLNGDGLGDIVSGIFNDGAIFYSINTGTKQAPKFDTYKFFTTNGDSSFVTPT